MAFEKVFKSSLVDYSKDFEQSDKLFVRWERFKFDNNISFSTPCAYDDKCKYRDFKRIIDTTCGIWLSYSGITSSANCRRPSLAVRCFFTELPDSKHNFELILWQILSIIDIQICEEGEPYLNENSINDRPANNTEPLTYPDYYGSYTSGKGKDKPIIRLYYGRIVQDYKKELVSDTASIVLVHELSHALMDPYNYLDFSRINRLRINYHTPFGYAKEESLANAFTLRLVNLYKSKKLYHEARNFMMLQPLAYRYGLEISATNDIILSWINSKVKGCSQRETKSWMAKYLSYKYEHSVNRQIKGTGLFFCIRNIQQVEETKRIMRKAGTSEKRIEEIFNARRVIVDKYLRISIEGIDGYVDLPPKQKPLYLLLLRLGKPLNSLDLCNYFDELKDYYQKMSDNEDVVTTIHGLVHDDKSWAKNTINECIVNFLEDDDSSFNYLIQTESCSKHTKKYWIPVAVNKLVDIEFDK